MSRRLLRLVALALLALAVGAAACGRPRDAGRGDAASRPVGYSWMLEVSGRREQVGFDAPVELRAQVIGGEQSPRRWTYRWQQIWGPPARDLRLEGGIARYTSPAPPPREEALASRGRVLPLGAAAAGRQVFLVTATSGERRLERTVEVFPAYPTAAWPRMAVGVVYYLPQDPRSGATWSQQGRLALGASGVPYLHRARATAVDWHTLTAPGGGLLKVRSGVWLGDRDCGRADCHPREHQGWQTTAHATIFTRGVSGQLARGRGRYREECVACHTVGYQPETRSDGFGDRAHEGGWRFPDELSPSTWRAVPTALKERANVQCESCHGPGWFYTGYGDDVCAQCHDQPPLYTIVAQARRNRMNQSQRSIVGGDSDAVCRECHVGSGFLRSVRGHASSVKPVVEVETEPRGVTCPICHDPHEAECRRQLRFCGEVEIPGFTFDVGQGATCIACHNGEADVVRGSLLRPFVPGTRKAASGGHGRSETAETPPDAAPHAPQFEVLTGRGGKYLTLPRFMPGVPNAHMRVPDACVGCHYSSATRRTPTAGHTFKLLDDPRPSAPTTCASRLDLAPIRTSRATANCARCHGRLASLNVRARGDYDGDGQLRGFVEEIEGLMRLLQRELGQQIAARGLRDAAGRRGVGVTILNERIVVADDACQPLRAKDGQGLPLGDELLTKAARNVLLVIRDRSAGIHNPVYIVRLLQNTITSLEEKRGAAVRHAWKSP